MAKLSMSLPITDKHSLRQMRAPKKFAEMRVTSGSTGDPLYVYYSKKATDAFINRTVLSLKKSGVSKKDTVLNLFAYGNYIPGSMYERGCLAMGVAIMPLGAPNTYSKEKIIEAVCEVKPNVWFGVPSYCVTLIDILVKSRKTAYLPKKVVVAGERLLEVYIKKFKKHGIVLENHFGLTECPAIGVSKRGRPDIIEIINKGIYTEAIKEGNYTYFIVTDLLNSATPIVRYKTGDLISNVITNRNGSVKEMSVVGRSDDLVKIQGILVSKTKIINTVSHYTNKFIVYIKTQKNRDCVDIVLPQDCRKCESRLDTLLSEVKRKTYIYKKDVVVPQTISFKNRHIIDLRK